MYGGKRCLPNCRHYWEFFDSNKIMSMNTVSEQCWKAVIAAENPKQNLLPCHPLPWSVQSIFRETALFLVASSNPHTVRKEGNEWRAFYYLMAIRYIQHEDCFTKHSDRNISEGGIPSLKGGERRWCYECPDTALFSRNWTHWGFEDKKLSLACVEK